jgi:hypothetical protein
MIGLIIVLISLIALLCGLLISPIELEVDTRIPFVTLRWHCIGQAVIWYDNKWWLNMRIVFYKKTICFSELKSKPKKINDAARKKKPKTSMKIRRILRKVVRVVKTFRVTEWQLAFDSGDHTRNAQLYPFNFLPTTFKHLHINFRNENFLVLKIRTRPWKIVYAYLR